jgi:hypothetical protein
VSLAARRHEEASSSIEISSTSDPDNGGSMARKTVFVSDFSNKEIADDKQAATITVKFGDGRRGVIVADAHADDKIVADIAKVGRQQARRGRRPKAEK